MSDRDGRACAVILVTCVGVAIAAFALRPHSLGPTYGPAPYHYNTDLTLWVELASHPVAGLSSTILGNRPLFGWLGWACSHFVRLFTRELTITGGTRSGGTARVDVAIVGGLLVANWICYALTGLLVYALARLSRCGAFTGLCASLAWASSGFAFAWSYHPTNQMGGLVVLLSFHAGLLLLTRNPAFWRQVVFGAVIGSLMLMKAYLVVVPIYLVWAVVRGWRRPHMIVGAMLMVLPTLLWSHLVPALTGKPFVDYHLGSGGLAGFVSARLQLLSGKSVCGSLLEVGGFLPVVLLAPLVPTIAFGVIVTGNRIARRVRLRPDESVGLLLITGVSAFLMFTGFFIPRHGSDFVGLTIVVGVRQLVGRWRTTGIAGRFSLAGIHVLATALTWTNGWLTLARLM